MADIVNERMPQLVAFDLDYTLWDFWVDTHVSPPFKRDGNTINQATDRARQLLTLLLLPAPPSSSTGSKRAIDFFDTLEIYPGSKIKHFKTLHKKTGIPYHEMLFFDDEWRNKEVESLGVTMQHIRDGMSWKYFRQGLETWRKRYPAEDESGSATQDERN
ncbi:hypothetical protein FRC07_002482 [Ceratobasidium sp. 392]|nr:hypothetical protein FRC07_002482 [Ceratobasidium sp. 392]